MALIKLGAMVADARGSIGGTVFSRNRYGAYVRNKTKPINPNTALQQEVKASLAFLTDRWSQTVTAAQRTAWDLYAASVVMTNKLGESINLSGFNHYIRSNLALKRAGRTLVDAGPVIFEIPDADPTFAVTGSEATQELTFTYDATLAWDTETGGYIFFYQGTPQNPQRNFFGGPWRFIGLIAGADGAPVASPAVNPAIFAIAEGQRQWVYARISRADGRLSAPFRADVFVAA